MFERLRGCSNFDSKAFNIIEIFNKIFFYIAENRKIDNNAD